jgi:anti-sigma-K factor RskA
MSDDVSNDVHALSGAYAVDALDDVERARFERHLSGCSACQAEVASLTAAAGELAAIAEQAPPPGMRARVMADIARVRPLPPLTSAEEPPESSVPSGSDPATTAEAVVPMDRGDQQTPTRRRRLWRGLVAAAVALLLAIGGFVVWRSSTSQPSPTVADQVLAAPDATRTTKRFPDGSTATVVRSDALGKAVLVTSGMAAPPSGKVYQLWLRDPSGHFASAGLVPPGSDQVVVFDGDARTATGAGITVEPSGGSSQPTTTPIVLFSFT